MSNSPSPRVQEHLKKLQAAGLQTEAFFEALISIRDDTALPKAHRDALYKVVAMESFVWYLEALRGAPVDRFRAMEALAEIDAQNSAAIKKRTPGDTSAALIQADIGFQKDDPNATQPMRAVTVKKPPEHTATVIERKPPSPPDQASTVIDPLPPRPAPRAQGRPRPKKGVTRLDRPKKK